MNSAPSCAAPRREAVSYIASADVFVKLPPAGRFLCRQRKRQKKPPKETFVVANLAGFVFPVYERAGKTRKCSIAPPLRPEAGGFGAITNGIGGFLWDPSPTAKGETVRRFPPLDPPSGERGREFSTEQRYQVTYAGGSNGGRRRNGPHRLPRRRKSHGLRIRGYRKSRECSRAFDCSSSSNRSTGFGLSNGGCRFA